jgi:hypothetical protein
MTITNELIGWALLEGSFFVSSLFYLRAVIKAMRLAPVPGQPKPWTIWLELVPVFNLVWQFRNVEAARNAFPKQDNADMRQDMPRAYLEIAAWVRVLAYLFFAPMLLWLPLIISDEMGDEDPRAIPLAVVLCSTIYCLWQRGRYAHQVRRLSEGRPAQDLSLAEMTSNEPAVCSCSVKIAADPKSIEEACLAWARDAGWHRVRKAKLHLKFRLHGRCHPARWEHDGATIEVHLFPQGIATDARVDACWDSWGIVQYAFVPQMARAAVAFTRGVCSDLARCGIAVTPTEFGVPHQKRARLKAITRCVRWAELALFVLIPLLCVASVLTSYMQSDTPFAITFIALMSCPVLFSLVEYARRRAAGMRGHLSLWSAGVFGFLLLVVILVTIDPTGW